MESSRRAFNTQAALGAAGLMFAPKLLIANDKPAILGAPLAKTSWPSWPVIGAGEREGVASWARLQSIVDHDVNRCSP